MTYFLHFFLAIPGILAGVGDKYNDDIDNDENDDSFNDDQF